MSIRIGNDGDDGGGDGGGDGGDVAQIRNKQIIWKRKSKQKL